MENKLKMAVISGASEALRFKKLNPEAIDEEIMQYVTDNSEKIAEKIDNLDEIE